MARRSKFKIPVVTLLLLILLVVGVTVMAIVVPKEVFDNALVAIIFWVLMVRVLICGIYLSNINYYIGGEVWPIIAFIPYVQGIILTDSKKERIAYLVLPVVAALVFVVGTSSPILSLLTFDNVEKYFTAVQIVAGVIMVAWRLLYAKLHASILYQSHEILNEAYSAPDSSASGCIQTFSNIYLYLSCFSFLLPGLSLAGHVSLLLESMRLRGLKNVAVRTKKAEANGAF